MKKILIIGPPPSTKGGVTIWIKIVLDYLNNNKNNNVEVTHLVIERTVSLTHLLPVYKRLYYSIKDYTRGMLKLVKTLRQEKYDKVHITSSLGAGIIRDWLYVKIVNYYNAKAILHYHCGTMSMHLSTNGWKKKLLLFTLKNSYKSIVLDEESYRAITSLGFSNVTKIGNSFNVEIESLEKSRIIRNENEILFVGHNVREKGIFELIDACSTMDNVTLNIYGPQNEIIQREIDEKLKHITFKGTINFMGLRPSNEIYKAMRRASLFVLPTYTEGFPYVIVEAMASECPIITTPVGAIKEMLTLGDELVGYIVNPKDAIALHKQISYCINHKDEIREQARKAKLKAYKEYSTSAVMTKFINLWKE